MIHPISIMHRVLDRIFPKAPDFFTLLAEQATQVTATVNLLVDYMATNDEKFGDQIRKNEHAADTVKVSNLHTLNEAFATDIDREDIYRAIMDLDEIVNYCKDCVSEMEALQVCPDNFTYELATTLREGCQTLAAGFGKLGKLPADAAIDANSARKAGRHMEKLYRKALAALFQGEDFLNMIKRREIYQHLDRAGGKLEHCANTLHDIVVKLG